MKLTRFRSIPSLRKVISDYAGRNSEGKITVRHRGGGHKQAYRKIDWFRSSPKSIVVGFEYDPQRNARLAKLYHQADISTSNSSYSYILAPSGIKLFQEVSAQSYQHVTPSDSTEFTNAKLFQPGDHSTIKNFEPGDFIHAVEAHKGCGPIFARAAGTFCQVMSLSQVDASASSVNHGRWATVRVPSGSHRLISFEATATFGTVAISSSFDKNLEKAGRSRWLGWRPSVRGVARNPVDHPHGGGQGKTSGGRPSVTFKAWPTKGQPTRSPKRLNAFILTPRKRLNILSLKLINLI